MAEDEIFFFDEIRDISLNLRAKLLRVIERREIRRVGETITRRIYACFVFATNKNFQDEIYAAKFRKNFFYRINVSSLFIPPLKERKEDIPILVKNILEKEKKEI